ncbi:MAG: hypothetical protein HC795_04795 [Coleofasciculaceae cyanobacterium RL_1_1]|nr:hypothetical protein [Coleofasciculaceae cyanobacterium RL_1_1]
MKRSYFAALTLLATSTTILSTAIAATVAATAQARHSRAVSLSAIALNATSPTKVNAHNLKLQRNRRE